MNCTRSGCPGEIDGGYCNYCGTPAGPTAPAADSLEHLPTPATAAPRNLATTGPRTGTRRGTTRAGSAPGDRLGGGRVDVPPAEIHDAADAVLENPSIPESKRFCGNPDCGKPVGRSRDGRPAITAGFCPACQHPFSFAPKLATGVWVHSQYEIVGCVAHGGLGWVYLAIDHFVEGRLVVLKGMLNTGDIDVIRAEVGFLDAVDHPNIVKVYNFVEHDGDPYIVMEYVRGKTLRAILDARKEANGGDPDPLPASHAITFVLAVLPAFGHLHKRGLLYCDFKPDNVIRTQDSLKLIDMGAVYRIDDQTSAIYGTPGYQAPEIADTGPTVPSDIYTVGRTLAALCTNTRGYQTTYARSLPPAEDVPLFSQYDSLYRLLTRATAADPDDRFQSADEMSEQLQGVLREIVATESGSPWPAASSLFTGELRGGSDDPADWRALPVPLVAVDDPAAGFLATVTATAATHELFELLAQAPDQTVEVKLLQARALIDTEQYESADTLLNEIAVADPWEWRVAWYSGVAALAKGDPARAHAEFRSVYATLPGELAPKLAMACADECSGNTGDAAHWYDIVSRTDPGFTNAVFGLARCRVTAADNAGAIAAYDRVLPNSSSYVDAQIAKAERMLHRDGRTLELAEVVAAGQVVERLPIKGEPRARLTADVLSAALDVVEAMDPTTVDAHGDQAPTVLGHRLDEHGIRVGLEATYRDLARHRPSGDERIALVDRANHVRPRTLV